MSGAAAFPGQSPAADLALGLDLADAADAISLARFRAADLRVTTKPDQTPVTDADTAVEAEIRRLLAAARPDDVVLGEEEGERGGRVGATRRWILDPIDGTKNYARGVPVWGTLLGLEETAPDGSREMTVGVVSAPALGRRWWAHRGGGAWTTDSPGTPPRRLSVSGVEKLGDAFLSYASLAGWRARPHGLENFLSLEDACWRTRAYGDFWSHMLVAEGAVDVAAEPDVSLWDMAAIVPVVEEAGGRFTSLDGRRGPGWGNVLSTNGLLHDTALGILGGNAPA